MRVIEHAPNGLRHMCVVCGNPNNGPLVDTMYNTDAGVFVCMKLCMPQLAEAAGFITVEAGETLRDEIAAAKAALEQALSERRAALLDAETVQEAQLVLDNFMQIVAAAGRRIEA